MNVHFSGLYYTLEPFVEYKKGRLLKAGNLYGKTPEECTFDVRCIGRHAFTYTLWSYEHQVVTFSGHLNNIETRAFTYPSVPYEPRQEGEVTTKNVGAIRLQGWVPPACEFVIQDGMYHLDEPMSVKDFIPCKIIVPNKSRWYIGGTIWVPYIIDDYDYGLLCGTMTPDDREAYYSKQDQYAPRVEEIFEKYEKIYNSSDWSVTAGIEANGIYSIVDAVKGTRAVNRENGYAMIDVGNGVSVGCRPSLSYEVPEYSCHMPRGVSTGMSFRIAF